jgi:phosphopantothenate-cysteine ligase/phosphopantothenoylcysteine decarboxylase/phosphopantothenate--cysteine ligase
MKLLVTAGNTQVPIDRVRCITNIFTGRTGGRIAATAHGRGHAVTVLTSHPEVLAEMLPTDKKRWAVHSYRTFDELEAHLAAAIPGAGFDAVIHSAAVSDYGSGGIFAPAPATRYDEETCRWQGNPPRLVDMTAGKVKSDAPELWLRLVRTPKLIDRIRTDWAFDGVLVKFKLEVGVSEEQLLQIAERSRRHSAADLMVANTLEAMRAWAYVGPLEAGYSRVSRRDLAERLLEAVEARHREKSHG